MFCVVFYSAKDENTQNVMRIHRRVKFWARSF